MLDAITLNVNWLAVVVGAVVAFALGMLWYSPKMFGTKWSIASGHDPAKMKDMKTPMHAMLAQALATFLLAWVIGVTETTGNMAFALLIALMAIMLIKSNGLWSTKKMYAIHVEVGFVFAMVVIMILAQAIF
jgi:hypothetical protein